MGGLKTFATGIKYTNIDWTGYTPSQMDFYERSTGSVALVGAWSGNVTFFFTRVGGSVTMSWMDFTNTATATDFLRTSVGIPSRFGSQNNVRMVGMGAAGAVNGPIVAYVNGTLLQFWNGTAYGNWTSGQAATVAGGSLSWNV
jgi:hypothetical protein